MPLEMKPQIVLMLLLIKVTIRAPSINSFSVNDSSVTLLSSSKTQTITFSANVTDNRSVTSISVSGGVTATDQLDLIIPGLKPSIMMIIIMEPLTKTLLLQHLMLLVINPLQH